MATKRCMIQYSDDAGKITVQVLRNITQNYLAHRLELKLKEGKDFNDYVCNALNYIEKENKEKCT